MLAGRSERPQRPRFRGPLRAGRGLDPVHRPGFALSACAGPARRATGNPGRKGRLHADRYPLCGRAPGATGSYGPARGARQLYPGKRSGPVAEPCPAVLPRPLQGSLSRDRSRVLRDWPPPGVRFRGCARRGPLPHPHAFSRSGSPAARKRGSDSRYFRRRDSMETPRVLPARRKRENRGGRRLPAARPRSRVSHRRVREAQAADYRPGAQLLLLFGRIRQRWRARDRHRRSRQYLYRGWNQFSQFADVRVELSIPLRRSEPEQPGRRFRGQDHGRRIAGHLTYLGGSDDDSALAIAVDSGGNAYVTGMTISSNFPVTQGAYQKSFKGRGGNDYGRGGDAFAAKFNPSGGLVYSTYLGGSRDDGASAIAIDGSGNAYIAGATLSTDFPTTPGAYQTSLKGFGGQPDIFVGGPDNVIRTGDVFVAKLNSSGSALVFSTLLGGSKDEAPSSIALDGAGNVYVGGGTLSSDFPTTANAYQRTFKGATAKSTQSFFLLGDGFISKLDPSGSSLLYSTLLGGSSGDAVMSIALDSAGGLYAAGMTSSDDFPASANAYQRSYRGPALAQMQTFIDGDGFVAKFDSSGRLAYSTYLGGESDDSVWAVAPDPSGNAIVAGGTNSRTFPVTSDALQKTFGGGGGHFYMQTGDAFIAKLDTAGATLLYSSYLGGSRDDGAGGMVLDSQGNAYLAGFSISNDFPVTAGAAQPSPGGSGNDDAMVAKISGLFSPPALTLNGISNAASYNASAVSPGEIVFVSAPASGPQNIVTAQVDTATNSLKTSLAGVQLLFDGVPAPLVYVARDQLSGIVPYRVASQQTSKVQMQANGVVSNAITVNVAPAVPGIFSADSTGKGPGAILNQDGSYNSPSNPAAPNDIIVFFGTGEGQTVPPGQDGLLATTVFPKPQLPVTVSIGGLPAEVVYAGAAPLYTAGLLQINARVPAGVASGSQPVVLHIGTADSQAGLTISIK